MGKVLGFLKPDGHANDEGTGLQLDKFNQRHPERTDLFTI
jgi:hypothetical protein